MAWVATLPEPVRLAGAFLLLLLLPAVFLGGCALALRQAASAPRLAALVNALAAGLTFCLLALLALRHSPAALAWSLAAAAVLSLVPLALDQVVRRGQIARHGAGTQTASPLPLPIRVALVLFVPLFFLWVGFVEETMRVTLPPVHFFPAR